MSAFEYINQIFRAKAVENGGIVRRKIVNVEKFASTRHLVKEVETRGFHLIETGDQYVIICNSGNFRLLR